MAFDNEFEQNDINPDSNSDKTSKKNNIFKEIIQWISVIALAVVIALLVRGFVFEFVLVDGPSMQNTMFTGERLLVYKLGYEFSYPDKGDIVVFKFKEGTESRLPLIENMPLEDKIIPKKDEIDYIKRVIAVPGDKVDIRDRCIYVNDKKEEGTYWVGETEPYSTLKYPFEVEPNKLFVVGDNRQMSSDSRSFGLIDIEQVKGKAVFRVFPFNKISLLH